MKQLLFSLIFIASILSTAQAQSTYIDSVIALVEDDIITNNELVNEVKRIQDDFKSKGRSLPSSETLNRQVLELMINKTIMVQEAKQRGITVTDTQLNNTMQNLAKRNQKTLAQFRQTLLASGIDYNTFRDEIKKELLINTLKTSYSRKNADISDQEVDDFITRNGSDAESIEYKLAHILITVPDGASTNQVNNAKSKADEIVARLKSGETFSKLASENSSGSNALSGGSLGWRKLAEIPSLFSNMTKDMELGQISNPIRSASGYHIIMLDSKRDSEQVIVQQTHTRHILIRPDELLSITGAKEQLESIREQIVEGSDFAELAKKHSNDPGSKGLGGDLGWVQKGTMVPAFEQMLLTIKVGDMSPVFETRFGWHILQVLGQKSVDETVESKRNTIRGQLTKQRKREVLELWEKRLRDQAFVKIITS